MASYISFPSRSPSPRSTTKKSHVKEKNSQTKQPPDGGDSNDSTTTTPYDAAGYTKLVYEANDSGLSLLPVTATGSRKEKTTKKKEMSTGRKWRSDTFLFVASAALLLGSTAALFAWLTFSLFPKPVPPSSLGCLPDGEGSWSVGLFYGRSPLSLRPIESVITSSLSFGFDSSVGLTFLILDCGMCLGAAGILQWNVWSNDTAAWPVANPVVTCASASDAGFPSNFVADPFLFIQVSELGRKLTKRITLSCVVYEFEQ